MRVTDPRTSERAGYRAARAGWAQRRGFVFLMVLAILAIATVMIGWMVTRARMQAAVVAIQLEEYRRHHEMLGVRAIVKDWIEDRDVREALPTWSLLSEPAHVIELPTGEAITLTVRDGQGAALARLDVAMTDVQRRVLLETLSRLPADDPRLIRRAGPPEISFYAAPAEVLLALTGDDPELFNLLLDLRTRPDLTRAGFLQEVRSAGYDASEGQDLLALLTLEPSLWRVNVEVVTEFALNRYTLLARGDGNIVEVLEWLALPEGVDFEAAGLELPSQENAPGDQRS